MLQTFTAPHFAPFSIALVVLIGLIAVELVSTVAGKSASTLIEALFGGGGGSDADADGHLGGALDWLNAGRVPVLVLLVLAITWFAANGFAMQGLLHGFAIPLPAWAASLLAAIGALPLTRWSSRLIARIVPRDETYVARGAHFIGRTGVVTVGPVRRGMVARMKVQDKHGNWHFPRIEPFAAEAVIAEGALVLVIEESGGMLRVAVAEGSLAERG